jgi:hypothetical protein
VSAQFGQLMGFDQPDENLDVLAWCGFARNFGAEAFA